MTASSEEKPEAGAEIRTPWLDRSDWDKVLQARLRRLRRFYTRFETRPLGPAR